MAASAGQVSPASAPSGFDKVSHLRYRLYLPSLLGLPLLVVYDSLRSFVWRQENYGPYVLREQAIRGYLSAQVAQGEIARMTGLGRARVNEHLKRLEQLGWLKSAGGQRSGYAKVYDIGVRQQKKGVWAEHTYADVAIDGWYQALDALSLQHLGTPYRKLGTSEQIELCAEYLSALPGGVPKKKTGGVPKRAKRGAKSAASGKIQGIRFKPRLLQGGVPESDTPAEGGVPAEQGGVPKNSEMSLSEAAETAILCGLPPAQKYGGVFPVRTGGCSGSEQRSHEVCQPKSSKSKRKSCSEKSYIDSEHRMSPTGKEIHTSYVFLTPSGTSLIPSPSGSESESAGPISLRSTDQPSPASDPEVGESLPRSRRNPPNPPNPPTPQFRSTPLPRKKREGVVTKTGIRFLPPVFESAPEMPSTPRTPATPSPSPQNAPEATEGGDSAPLKDVAAIVAEAKARSRAALQTKLDKAQAKQAKRDNLNSDMSYRQQRSGAMRLEQAWREEMDARFPDVPHFAWFKRGPGGKMTARKEGKLVADLLDGYGSEETVENLVRVFISRWDVFGPMLTKSQDSLPTLGLLYACHASVLAESKKLTTRKSAVEEYEDWRKANPDPFASPPPELLAAYKAASAKKGKK